MSSPAAALTVSEAPVRSNGGGYIQIERQRLERMLEDEFENRLHQLSDDGVMQLFEDLLLSRSSARSMFNGATPSPQPSRATAVKEPAIMKDEDVASSSNSSRTSNISANSSETSSSPPPAAVKVAGRDSVQGIVSPPAVAPAARPNPPLAQAGFLAPSQPDSGGQASSASIPSSPSASSRSTSAVAPVQQAASDSAPVRMPSASPPSLPAAMSATSASAEDGDTGVDVTSTLLAKLLGVDPVPPGIDVPPGANTNSGIASGTGGTGGTSSASSTLAQRPAVATADAPPGDWLQAAATSAAATFGLPPPSVHLPDLPQMPEMPHLPDLPSLPAGWRDGVSLPQISLPESLGDAVRGARDVASSVLLSVEDVLADDRSRLAASAATCAVVLSGGLALAGALTPKAEGTAAENDAGGSGVPAGTQDAAGAAGSSDAAVIATKASLSDQASSQTAGSAAQTSGAKVAADGASTGGMQSSVEQQAEGDGVIPPRSSTEAAASDGGAADSSGGNDTSSAGRAISSDVASAAATSGQAVPRLQQRLFDNGPVDLAGQAAGQVAGPGTAVLGASARRTRGGAVPVDILTNATEGDAVLARDAAAGLYAAPAAVAAVRGPVGPVLWERSPSAPEPRPFFQDNMPRSGTLAPEGMLRSSLPVNSAPLPRRAQPRGVPPAIGPSPPAVQGSILWQRQEDSRAAGVTGGMGETGETSFLNGKGGVSVFGGAGGSGNGLFAPGGSSLPPPSPMQRAGRGPPTLTPAIGTRPAAWPVVPPAVSPATSAVPSFIPPVVPPALSALPPDPWDQHAVSDGSAVSSHIVSGAGKPVKFQATDMEAAAAAAFAASASPRQELTSPWDSPAAPADSARLS